jgi:uncharacterized protein YjcR
MKSIFAIAMMLAAATSAEYMTESEAQIMTFTEYEELMTEEVEVSFVNCAHEHDNAPKPILTCDFTL